MLLEPRGLREPRTLWDQARARLFDYMEVFYNRQRRHSTINYVAPLAFEKSASA